MRAPPQLAEISKFPVVGGTALLAVGLAIAQYGFDVDMSALVCSPHIALGQPWRLVTSALLHGGVVHLIFNVYWLWVLGSFVEQEFGHLFAAGLLIVLAVGSAAAEYAVLEGGVGLSGVGYGLFGLLWMLSRYDRRYHDVMDQNTVTLFVAWFFICIVLTYTGAMAIANIAHGVGFLLGAMTGWSMAQRRRKWLGGAAAGALTAGLCLLAIFFRPAVNLSPERGMDESYWGYEALADGDYPLAEQLLRRAVSLNPNLGKAWHNLGVTLHRRGKADEADRAFERAVALGVTPDDIQPTTNPVIDDTD